MTVAGPMGSISLHDDEPIKLAMTPDEVAELNALMTWTPADTAQFRALMSDEPVDLEPDQVAAINVLRPLPGEPVAAWLRFRRRLRAMPPSTARDLAISEAAEVIFAPRAEP